MSAGRSPGRHVVTKESKSSQNGKNIYRDTLHARYVKRRPFVDHRTEKRATGIKDLINAGHERREGRKEIMQHLFRF